MLEKLIKVTIAYLGGNVQSREKRAFNVKSCSCLPDFSLTIGWLKRGRLLCFQHMPDTGHHICHGCVCNVSMWSSTRSLLSLNGFPISSMASLSAFTSHANAHASSAHGDGSPSSSWLKSHHPNSPIMRAISGPDTSWVFCQAYSSHLPLLSRCSVHVPGQ